MNKTFLVLIQLSLILSACVSSNVKMPIRVTDISTQSPVPTTLVLEKLFIGDGGLISGQPCNYPCFFGIHVGKTRLDEVVSTFKDNGISPCYQFNERIITCGEGVFSIIVGADVSTSIVSGITYYPSISISVREVVEKYGNPNSVIVEFDNTGTPESPKLRAFLSWDSTRMSIALADILGNEEEAYTIKESTKIWSVDFSDETSYFTSPSSEILQSWNGYGPYKP